MQPKNILLSLFVTMMALSKSYGQFEKDRNYKNWRIHHTQGIYKPATATLEYGNYSINTRAMRGYKIGLEYYFRKTKKLQFFTGLNMHFIPLDNYYYELPGIELGIERERFFDSKDRFTRYRHNVLSMPIGIQYRKSYNDKINIFAKAGVNLDFLQYGEYSNGYAITNNSGNRKKFLEVSMISQYNKVVYPSLFIGGGIDYYTSWSKLHVSLNIQKSVMPYMRGYFAFYNLDVSDDSYGTYKLNGDYIGLDVGITLKKFKKKKIKQT